MPDVFGGAALLVWVVGAFVNVMIAQEKGRSGFLCFLASVFLPPLVVWGYLVAVPSLKPDGSPR